MKDSKLEELINSLSVHEQKAFRRFLLSPYFNEDKIPVKLFDRMIQTGESPSKEALFKKIFSSKKFNDKEWRYITSQLTKHVEYFLTIRYLDQNLSQWKLNNAKALALQDCNKAHTYYFNELKRKPGIQNADHYYNLFDVHEAHLNYTGKKQTRKLKLDYENVLHNLDAFYISKKLQLFCEVTNLKNILSGEYPLHLLSELKKLATGPGFKNIPVIQLYYYVLLTLEEPEEEKHFYSLQKEISKHHHLFPVEELSNLYQYIKNYCVKKINSGVTDYLRVLFSIYKQMLENRRIMYHDYFSQWEFKNVVSISLRLGEKEWCRTFIYKYINYLDPGERKNALTFNLAYLNFINGYFKTAIRMLRDVEFTDVFYKIDSRVILLKCYYEMDDFETYFYHASAFRLFLLRNRQISPYQKRINRNLIIFLSKLMRSGASPTKIRRLKEDVLKEKNVADLNWLLEKIDQLT